MALALAACSPSSTSGQDVLADCGYDGVLELPTPNGPMTAPTGGDHLPLVTVASLDDCMPESTGDWVGQPLVINFWASWCGPCRTEMPDLAATAQRLGDAVRFVGVTFDDRPEDSREFLQEVPVPYDVYVDAHGHDLFRALEARGTPATVLVAADGMVVHRHAGPITSQTLEDAMVRHLGLQL